MNLEILRREAGQPEPDAAKGNPFLTAAYARYREALGERACLLRVAGRSAQEASLVGFERVGRFGSRLEVPSLPLLPESVEWWRDLMRALRRAGMVVASFGTFASPPGAGPPEGTRGAVRIRHEFPLGLDVDPLEAMSAGHRRNVRKGEKAGLALRLDGDAAAHHALSAGSLARRRKRGERTGPGIGADDAAAAVSSGAARIMQACAGAEVLSSIEVLLSPEGAYYHSAGTSATGMSAGASHWLVHAAAVTLRREGIRAFNLGGAEPSNPGLWRFKESFGARPVATRAASVVLTGRLLRPFFYFFRAG